MPEMNKVRTYLFSYHCGGHEYSLDVHAYTVEEARERVSSIGDSAVYLGIGYEKIPEFAVDVGLTREWASVRAFMVWLTRTVFFVKRPHDQA